MNGFLTQNMEWLKSRPLNQARIYTLLACATALFFELAVIRWHAADCQLFSYYKNLSLMSVFLGLGIGYSCADQKRSFAPLIFPGFLVQWLIFYVALNHFPWILGRNLIVEDHAMGMTQSIDLFHWLAVMLFVMIVFTASAITAIPLGQLCGVLMSRLNRLEAYGWNLAGSLLGILVFLALSFLWTGPIVWFLVLGALLLPMLASPNKAALFTIASAISLASAILFFEPSLGINYFSPYQNVMLTKTDGNPAAILRVSHFYYQKVLDLRDEAQAKSPDIALAAHYYNYPYELKPHPNSVLIVGAGTGNDVAAAVRNQARSVDAVEIDPLILHLGQELHPEHPYDSNSSTSTVHVHIDDARSFVRQAAQTGQKYDLVVYGLLDSHTMLSSFSSVRQDSFVYTLEGLRASRKLLSPDGLISLSFAAYDWTLAKKMYLLVREAFDGQEPLALETKYDAGVMFLAGPGLSHLAPAKAPLKEFSADIRSHDINVDIPTDDWPFPYLAIKGVPTTYIYVILILVAVSFLLIWRLSPAKSVSPLNLSSARLFLLGAGFLLIETRSITELGLLFGNTWIVVAAVISGILVVAFLSNLIVLKGWELPRALSVGFLCLCLMLGWGYMSSLSSPVLAIVLTSLPLFFAGQLFSGELRLAPTMTEAFTANLFGSICGGFFEYSSLRYGVRSLYLDSMVIYLLVGVLSFPRVVDIFSKWFNRFIKGQAKELSKNR